MRILFVDDTRAERIILGKRLQAAFPDDERVEAASGQEALQLLAERPFDVVLTDLMMPEMSGLDLLRRIKTEHPRVEVIVLTAMATIDSAVEAMREGARDYLEKPVNFNLLFEKLENMREFQESKTRAEEYRLAKETYETQAGEEVFALEKRLVGMRHAIDEALAELEKEGGEAAERIRNAVALLRAAETETA